MKLEVRIKSSGHWGNAGNGIITIKNNGETLPNWQFPLVTDNFVINEFWALSKTGSGNNIIVKPPDWKLAIQAGETRESGFSYTGSSEILRATSSDSNITIIMPKPDPIDPVDPIEPIDPSDPGPLKSDKKVFGYFSEWSIYDRQYDVSMIPANKLTHVLYAFMLPNPDRNDFNTIAANYAFPPKPYNSNIPEGTLTYHDEFAGTENIRKFRQLKLNNPHLKTLISIGGWTLSWTLSKIAANRELRSRLVKTSVKFVIDNGFDGLDVDWEFPGKQGIGFNYVDVENDQEYLITLLRELREELDLASPNKHLELCCAMGCDPEVIKRYEGIEPYLDYILLMTYDFAGAWDNGGHHSPLYNNPNGSQDPQWNAHSAVELTKSIGFDVSKICMGSPMYGRGWTRIVPEDPSNPIFGQSTLGPAVSYSGAAGEPGLTSWRHLVDVIDKNGLTRYYDEEASAVYIHNSATGETWSYEDEVTLKNKTDYIIENKLAGVMFWELSDDTRNNVSSLLNTAVTAFNNEGKTRDPTPVPSPDPTPDPTPVPTPDPTPVPTPDPTPVPSPDPTPDPPKKNVLKIVITNENNTDFILKPGESIEIVHSV